MGRNLIINYRSFAVIGGIEVYVVELIDFMINHGVHVIWLKEANSEIHDSFKNILLDSRVEIVPVSNNLLLWFRFGKFQLNPTDENVMLSFIVMSKLKGESIVRQFKECNVKSIYAVPDTKGLAYYIETNFSGVFRKIVYKLMADVHNRWQKNNQLLFFAHKQVDAMADTYKININNGHLKVLKEIKGIPKLDIAHLQNRCRREKFNIITIGRLDFPHKGYILGLVKSFNRLKKKYPQLTLTIIGDGHSRNDLEKEISTYDDNVKADIRLLGAIPSDKLPLYVSDSHLNISVAAGVGVGAKCGVISIPARNYCTGECEVYGFLPENRLMTVATTPGNLVDPYIEKVINMSDDEFYRMSVESYKSYKDNEEVDPWFVFNATQDYRNYILPKFKLYILIMINYLMKVKYFLTFEGFNRREIIKHFFNFSR